MSVDTQPVSDLDFCLHCLGEAEKDLKSSKYPSWRYQRALGSWGQIGLKAFDMASRQITAPDDALFLQKRLLSSPLWQDPSCSYTEYALAELFCLDQALSRCIAVTQTPPSRDDVVLLLKQGLWASATACLELDVDLHSFPWEVVWKRGVFEQIVPSPVIPDLNASRDQFLEKTDQIISQHKAPISFLGYIPPSRLKKLIDGKTVNPEILLERIEKEPSLKMLPSNALLVTETCIALWDKTNPLKTREKVAEWSVDHPSLVETCKVIPTAYYKGDGTPFDQWHWGLLSDWRQIMSSYKIGRRIDIVKTFKNNPVLQGDMNMLRSYMEMAQVRPNHAQLSSAVSLKDFWSSFLLFQSLNSNPASVASFWVSCARGAFFQHVNEDIQQRVEKEIVALALLPKEEMPEDLRSIRPFVAGAYQYILYQKEEFTQEVATQAWRFLKNFPTSLNQQPVVAKIIHSIKNNVFSIPEQELSDYLGKASLNEKVKLELSTASASASSSYKSKMKM